MLARHRDAVTLASINTGSTLYPSAPPRGTETFVPIEQVDWEAARLRRTVFLVRVGLGVAQFGDRKSGPRWSPFGPRDRIPEDRRPLETLALQRFPCIGETGFEPATARPPAGCATRLRHSPWLCSSVDRSGRRESNPFLELGRLACSR